MRDFRSLRFSDFHDFYIINPFWVVTFGLKYKLVTLNFGGTRHHLISDAYAEHAHQSLTCTLSASFSSERARSVHASVPYAHAQHALKALFKFGIFTLLLSIRIRN